MTPFIEHIELTTFRPRLRRYGTGKWRFIQKDAVLGAILGNRSNVDLKVSGAEIFYLSSPASKTPSFRFSIKHSQPWLTSIASHPNLLPSRAGQVEEHVPVSYAVGA